MAFATSDLHALGVAMLKTNVLTEAEMEHFYIEDVEMVRCPLSMLHIGGPSPVEAC